MAKPPRRGRPGAHALPHRPAARRRAVDAVLSGDPAGAGRSLRRGGASVAGAAARRRRAGGGRPTAGGVRALRGDSRKRNAASDYYLYRAATLLSVGRVEEARADIGQALMRDPSDGRADALSAVIAVAQNDRERALEEARRAVELSPRSAAAKIALSYAEQARFRHSRRRARRCSRRSRTSRRTRWPGRGSPSCG